MGREGEEKSSKGTGGEENEEGRSEDRKTRMKHECGTCLQVQGTHYHRMLDFFNELETCHVVETGQVGRRLRCEK